MQIRSILSKFWPNRKTPRDLHDLRPILARDVSDLSYVSRLRIEKVIAASLAQNDNLVIYGPPRQGKTTLLTRQLTGGNAVFIECRPGFKRTQIYRVVLSSLGYAVLV